MLMFTGNQNDLRLNIDTLEVIKNWESKWQ